MISRTDAASGLGKGGCRIRRDLGYRENEGYSRLTEALQELPRQIHRMRFRVIMQKYNFETL